MVTAAGVVPFAKLSSTDLTKLRRKMQRYAKALPPGNFFGGMLEADYVVDQCAGVDHWQWHGHFMVVVPCSNSKEGKLLIRKACPVQADQRRGIYRPVLAQQVHRHLGGLRGAIEYGSKALQIHGVHRKVVTLNASTGLRGRARAQPLSLDELATWAGFASGIKADSLMVWAGYRRYGDHLVPTSSHGGGGRHGGSE